ncbi:hypothetical protein E2C01_102402 [Portunus trituberculatus]|uniref:Uncharacterized protein n=1 Tax=Portunus trituberculatus TaxID=210409 RepID=A0A5B7KIA2_PORTR|nr:hypothetical protein [Portunus trituberculatus]
MAQGRPGAVMSPCKPISKPWTAGQETKTTNCAAGTGRYCAGELTRIALL